MEKTRNDKSFFYVFPTLKVEEDIQILFADVEVKKITTNSRRDFLHVHIFSRHLIQKKQIWQMERRIKDQLFGNVHVEVLIEEEYALSGHYKPEALINEYRESIILELKEQSVLASSMFSQAKIRFEESNVVSLELLDTIVSEGRKEEILALLENIFEKRFHIPADIRITYREPDGAGTREYDEQRLQQEINAIFERRARQRGEYVAPANKSKDPDHHNGADQGSGQGTPAGVASGGKHVAKGNAASGNAPGHNASSSSGGRRTGRKGDFKKKDFYRPIKQGDDPNLIYGKSFDDEPITLDQVVTEMGEVTIHGKIINFDTREIRNEKTIIMFAVTDFTDTITVKMFTRNDQLPELLGELKKGAFVKIKGITTIDKFDGELTIGSVTGIKKIGDFTVSREDLSPIKRVELHCHTKMSDMDGVSEVKDIVKRAHDWGHPAIAITDHGVTQAFPDANHYIETLDKDDPFKVLYGVEGYVVVRSRGVCSG